MSFRSFKYAFKGIKKAFCSEHNFRLMIVCFVLVIIVGIILQITGFEWAVIILSCAGVLTSEMLNSAIESAIDSAISEHHPLVEKAKDIAAGAVLIFSVFSVVVALIIFVPHIIHLFENN